MMREAGSKEQTQRTRSATVIRHRSSVAVEKDVRGKALRVRGAPEKKQGARSSEQEAILTGRPSPVR
jgi:hypothetical protein